MQPTYRSHSVNYAPEARIGTQARRRSRALAGAQAHSRTRRTAAHGRSRVTMSAASSAFASESDETQKTEEAKVQGNLFGGGDRSRTGDGGFAVR